VAANGIAPFPEFLSQGALLAGQGLGLQVFEPLVNQVQGVVYQLGRLLGGHGEESGNGQVVTGPSKARCSGRHDRRSSERINSYSGALVTNGKGSSRSALGTLLLGFGAAGGLALLVWLTLVMLDLKHLNTSGFTLP
jgi:hypothetical protein